MKKKITLGLAALIAASSVFANISYDTAKYNDVVGFKKYGMNIKAIQDNGGKLVKAVGMRSSERGVQALSALVLKDGHDMIVGQSVDAFDKTGKPLFGVSKEVMNEILKNEVFTIGNGENEFILFTDPQCPYCQQFEKSMKDLHEDVKIHVLFYPLSFHDKAMKMSSYIISLPKEQRAEAFAKLSNGDSSWEKYKGPIKLKEIEKSVLLGTLIGVAGTPSLFDVKGNKIDLRSWVPQNVGQPKKVEMKNDIITQLFESNFGFALNGDDNKNTPVYILADPSSPELSKFFKSDSFKNLLKSTKIVFIPSAASDKGALYTLVIAQEKTADGKRKRFDSLLKKTPLTKAEMESVKEFAASKDTQRVMMNAMVASQASGIIKKNKQAEDKSIVVLKKDGSVLFIK